MSNRLIKKAAMHSIISQEEALKKVRVFQEEIKEDPAVSTASISELLADIEHELKESIDWSIGIHEIGG